jgi:hypothetical protein
MSMDEASINSHFSLFLSFSGGLVRDHLCTAAYKKVFAQAPTCEC